MTLEITFNLKLRDLEYVAESELESHFDQYQDQLLVRDNHDGQIVITGSDQSEQHIEDELRGLVPNLCFDAVVRLLARQPATIMYFSYFGTFKLEPEADTVRLSGDFVAEAIYQRDELLPALFKCGWRFIRFLKRQHGEAWASPVQILVQNSAPARLALEQAGYTLGELE